MPLRVDAPADRAANSAKNGHAPTPSTRPEVRNTRASKMHMALSAHVSSVLMEDGSKRLNLRSVRRGALLRAAACGVTDDELQLLSGHKRRDTLMRYLGWGQMSSTMGRAAEPSGQDASPRGRTRGAHSGRASSTSHGSMERVQRAQRPTNDTATGLFPDQTTERAGLRCECFGRRDRNLYAAH
jgi:hypothetical protein